MITGVVATQPFTKGDMVCDYHGKLLTAAKGKARMDKPVGDAGNIFFFKDHCIDAQPQHCGCHPDTRTVGRLINHSRKNPNLKPVHCVLKVDGQDRDVILFKALRDISVDTELLFDYRVNS